MKLGVTLPTFSGDASALDAARRAQDAGVDGVFVFDHLWPLGRPDRPSLSWAVTLGAVASLTREVVIGALVARVGLVPDGVLVAQCLSLAAMAPGRFVAGLGTGDSKSSAENRSYGVSFEPADKRRLALARCASKVLAHGIPVWIGGGSPPTTALAADLGAAVNLWEGQPAAIAAMAQRVEVTWAGPLKGPVPEMAQWLAEIAAAGASWAICAWPTSVEDVVSAARLASGHHS